MASRQVLNRLKNTPDINRLPRGGGGATAGCCIIERASETEPRASCRKEKKLHVSKILQWCLFASARKGLKDIFGQE